MRCFRDMLLLVLIFVLLFLLFYFPNKITALKQTQRQQSNFMKDVQFKEDFYSLNFNLNSKMTGLKAPEISYSELKNDTVLLSQIVKTQSLLVLRYADINCNTCYEASLSELKDVFGDYFSFIAVLCSYQREKDFHVFKKINQIKFPIYRIESDAFDWAVESYNTPYYFVLHPDMKISNIYVPSKSFPEMNKAYLESVKRFLVD